MKIVNTLLLFFSIFIFLNFLKAQDTIYLKNPSFEDVPRLGSQNTRPIIGWSDCGPVKFPQESPPDIHPLPSKIFGVSMLPKEGRTYMGLVTRFDNSYESVSQKLETSLIGGKCYSVSVFLARSDVYSSPTRRSQYKLEDFTTAAILRIWGGKKSCDHEELLAQSLPVDNGDWRLFEFILKPSGNYDYFAIDAYYNPQVLGAYNGHVMVDGFSPIIEIDCN
jgi:hypothetical protein